MSELTPRLQELHDEIVEHCEAIARRFTEPVKVTVFVRNPAHPDGSRDILISSDTDEALFPAIHRCAANPNNLHSEVEVPRA